MWSKAMILLIASKAQSPIAFERLGLEFSFSDGAAVTGAALHPTMAATKCPVVHRLALPSELALLQLGIVCLLQRLEGMRLDVKSRRKCICTYLYKIVGRSIPTCRQGGGVACLEFTATEMPWSFTSLS